MKSRTHSAARTTSSRRSGSALTLGMRRSSPSSSIHSCGGSAMAAEPISGDFSELLAVRQRAELLQALVLDLPDPLARDVERAPHLVQRPRLLSVEPVAHLEDLLLPRRERAQDLLERVAPEGLLGRLLGQRRSLVGQEVAELRFLVVADRLLERHREL